MAWLFGVLGFVLGFGLGLLFISFFVRHLPKQKLLSDRSLRWTYGFPVWIMAGFGAWGGVILQQHFF
jgi:hypothetical protein